MIKLITFDLDDTLWDNGPVIRRAIHEGYSWLLEQHPALAEVHDIVSLNALKDEIKNSTPELEHRVSEVRIVGIQRALMELGYGESEARLAAEEAFGHFHHWRHQVELFEGVQECLQQLAENYRLAVITNGNADVNQLGLGHFFEFSINSEEMNRSKPDPIMFTTALERAGVLPEEALHVGDNLITDVKGAADVGMKTLWFNPEQKELLENDRIPDLVVNSVLDMPLMIKLLYRF
ncbi:HAD-IA family hydrolase [Parendozoicomonas haliclonae]|uniref:Flavin mononucleotide phosphatase YigB n=1 Tax=Parendozoicomonas haliclonae TaxID=1960125 RepID=A0A1X7ALN5_9GAMM|nr:HAD-IA family hydrolase [Parendozoicomonas haliclonae]SMA48487.1 Flavin mononucleotide phosphatase YigB [Parendozoicomonas haliclonae]